MPTQTALVLQGGGALGAYEFGVIKRLYEIPNFSVDIVAGVSIGAINAAVLAGAREDPIATLGKVWDDFTIVAPPLSPQAVESLAAVFGNRNFYRPRTDYLNLPRWTSYYDTAPLRSVLTKHVDFSRLNASRTTLLVTAANVETGRIETFDNRTPESPLSVDHVLASGSLPPGFPMTRVNGHFYWDGGLFDNTPLSPVIERLDPDPAVTKRLFVVNLFPSGGHVPENMLEVFDRVFEIVFANKLVHDVKTAAQVNEYVEAVTQIDAALDSLPPERAAAIRALPGYRRLQQYKIVQHIMPIENADPEVVFAPFDFSRDRIRRRIHAGYRDADRQLKSASHLI
jgi:predicted acylesterase/phospholipase RssA